MNYCGVCKYLSPKEHEQTNEKENHMCGKYNKRVRHLGHHPNLPRLPECDEPVEAPVGGKKEEDKV